MTDSVLQCNAIHKSIVDQFRVAIVYGRSVKHQPQRVGLSHELADEDISSCSPYADPPRGGILTVLRQLRSSRNKPVPVRNYELGVCTPHCMT